MVEINGLEGKNFKEVMKVITTKRDKDKYINESETNDPKSFFLNKNNSNNPIGANQTNIEYLTILAIPNKSPAR